MAEANREVETIVFALTSETTCLLSIPPAGIPIGTARAIIGGMVTSVTSSTARG
jgi:hypothetical protein